MIEINGRAGTRIETGFETAVQLARKTRQVVKLMWNGKPYRVRYSDTVTSLMRNWRRKIEANPRRKEMQRERRKRDIARHKHANRIARTLPQWLLVWAINPERLYGKTLSIIMAADALDIAKRYHTAEAIESAFADGSLKTIADSGAGNYETARIARLIAKGEFPGQDSTGLITVAWHRGQQYYDVFENPYGRT